MTSMDSWTHILTLSSRYKYWPWPPCSFEWRQWTRPALPGSRPRHAIYIHRCASATFLLCASAIAVRNYTNRVEGCGGVGLRIDGWIVWWRQRWTICCISKKNVTMTCLGSPRRWPACWELALTCLQMYLHCDPPHGSLLEQGRKLRPTVNIRKYSICTAKELWSSK